MSTETLKRKTSPSPLPLARDVGAPVRPLSPLRRAAVPLGLAGLLSAAAAAAIVASAGQRPAEAASGTAPSGPYTRFASGLSDIVHRFLDPEPEHVAGAMEPVSAPIVPAPVAPASIAAPEPEAAPTTTPATTTTPTTAPSAKPPKHLSPTPHHPKLGGKPMVTTPDDI